MNRRQLLARFIGGAACLAAAPVVAAINAGKRRSPCPPDVCDPPKWDLQQFHENPVVIYEHDVNSEALGGYLIPQELSDQVIAALQEQELQKRRRIAVLEEGLEVSYRV